jgi:hypothetical protein
MSISLLLAGREEEGIVLLKQEETLPDDSRTLSNSTTHHSEPADEKQYQHRAGNLTLRFLAAVQRILTVLEQLPSPARFSPTQIGRYLIAGLATAVTVLVPSFLRSGAQSEKTKPLHPTAYLDGLRGVAALIVVVHHFTTPPFYGLLWGWGSSHNGVPQYWFFQLPIVRILHHGQAMVGVFFVISGFALSYKPLKLVRSRQFPQLLDTLASSVFRRGMRLFLPCIVSTFFMACTGQLNWWHLGPVFRQATWSAQFFDWFQSLRDLLDPFHWERRGVKFEAHLWTIPMEFRGSIIIFVTVLGLAKTRAGTRLVTELGLVAWCFACRRWDAILFLSGMALAEMHNMRTARAAERAAQLQLLSNVPDPT